MKGELHSPAGFSVWVMTRLKVLFLAGRKPEAKGGPKEDGPRCWSIFCRLVG